jgi:hypothetical protein
MGSPPVRWKGAPFLIALTKSMRARYLVGLLFLLILTPLQAANPLVDVDWLLANLNNSNLTVLGLQPIPGQAI